MPGLRGVREQYGREAQRYDQHWSSYLERSLQATLDALRVPAGGRLLDVGCGTGVLLERIRDHRAEVSLHGVDPSPEMLRIARQRLGGGAALVIGEVGRLPYASATFEVVVSTSALHHWLRPGDALREIARVTRPGGQLVLTDWNDDFLPLRVFSRLLRVTDRSHYRSYTSAQVAEMVRSAGFEVEAVRPFRASWLWGMMTLSARWPT